jgi:hypothetical protein
MTFQILNKSQITVMNPNPKYGSQNEKRSNNTSTKIQDSEPDLVVNQVVECNYTSNERRQVYY